MAADRAAPGDAVVEPDATGSDLTAQDTIPRLLARRRREDLDVRALVDDGGVITYAELDDVSRTMAAWFVGAGVVKGDRVGLLMPNGIEWATIALGVMRIGAVLVPLSTLLRPPELLAQLNAAAVTHLVTVRSHRGRSYLDDLETAAPGLIAPAPGGDLDPSDSGVQNGWRTTVSNAGVRGPSGPTNTAQRHPAIPSLRRLWLAPDPAPPLHQVWPATDVPTGAIPATDDTMDARLTGVVRGMEASVRAADDMVVLFTSGSRGAPKGTIHTHGGALRAVAAGLDARCVGRGERLYIPMPFFWTGGFAGGLLTALVAGATLITEAAPEPARTLELLQRERVTLFRGWPGQAARLASHPAFATADLSSLRPGSLGALLPPDRRPAPRARPNLFGMTESFGPYCGDRLDVDLPPDKHGSCGRPFPGVEVRIADPDTGDELPPGSPGEIWLRGSNLLRGICGRHHTTVFTAEGFYLTGDLGRVDADGYLWYSGRLDDMFKVKGATVYPSEVEAALRSVPEVSQAFVTDVPAGDGQEQVGALVVVRADPADLADLTDLVDAARARLSAFKVPTLWLVVTDPDAVPLLATGKVDKPQLQQLLRAHGIRQISSTSGKQRFR